MLPSDRPWYARPLVILGGILSLVVLAGLGLFASQVVRYVRIAQSGGPDPYVIANQRRKVMSVTKLLEQLPEEKADATRIFSKNRKDPSFGNPNAKVKIVEFIDYECPFSKRAATELRSFMLRHASEVSVTIRDIPLSSIHERAADAARAARCVFDQGGNDLYWMYYDRLFLNQDQLSDEMLHIQAAEIGADTKAFDACMRSGANLDVVTASTDDGVAAGVRGTPTFFVNGKKIEGPLTQDILESIVSNVASSL